ncbi:UbiD family decarboxylase [Xanthobacter tagetidis]|nr:UbiD family decarboxylase [Xanthobacter tagetidis]MBB6305848.1 UbiD family decarboxylase [Xanthobacter tagetidis]
MDAQTLSRQDLSRQDLRSFLAAFEAAHPDQVLRVTDEVDLDYDTTAIAFEFEKRGSPILIFENVKGSRFPVLMNVFGRRSRFAAALGVPEDKLIEAWSAVDAAPIKPEVVKSGPILDVVLKGDAVDLSYLPIMRHFREDGGPYITNAMFIAKDPETGVRNASFHRMQMNGKTRFGTSLHSRRHLWNLARKASAMGLKEMPVVVVVGCHPLITFGAGLWKGPISADEYEMAGGFLGEPLKVVEGVTGPIEIPAFAEVAIEGKLLLDADENEGPFGEFTGYASERSTRNAVEVTGILHRRDAFYQNIVAGISDEHTLLLGVSQEARQLKSLRVHYPNVTAVSYPKSGTCLLHTYIAVKNPAPGEAANIAAAAFGDNLSLKLVIVVDDDIDVHDEEQVMWAVCTRFQANEDMELIRNGMGAILDPSNRNGATAKLTIDATCKKRPYARRHSLPDDVKEKARALVAKLA